MKLRLLPGSDVTRGDHSFTGSAEQTGQIVTFVTRSLHHFAELYHDDVGQNIAVLQIRKLL